VRGEEIEAAAAAAVFEERGSSVKVDIGGY